MDALSGQNSFHAGEERKSLGRKLRFEYRFALQLRQYTILGLRFLIWKSVETQNMLLTMHKQYEYSMTC